MHDLFKFKCDKVDTFQFENFNQTDIDTFLTTGQNSLIKTRYSGVNYKLQGFEQSQKRIDDLRTLIKDSKYQLLNINFESNRGYYNVSLANLNIEQSYWFTINDYLTIIDNSCNKTKRVLLKTMTHDRYSTIFSNPYRKPTLEYPVKLIADNFVQIDFGGNIDLSRYIIVYHLTYLTNPGNITFSNNEYITLPNHMHEEVVNEAVRSALEYIEQQRQQTFEKEIKFEE